VSVALCSTVLVDYFTRDEKTPSPKPKKGKGKRYAKPSDYLAYLMICLINRSIATASNTPSSAKKARVESSSDHSEQEVTTPCVTLL
jgi:hypothetical protein